MSFTPLITGGQNTTGTLFITDVSDYSIKPLNTFVSRSINIYKADGTEVTFTGAPDFPLDTTELSVTLAADAALRIVVEMVDNSNDTFTNTFFIPYLKFSKDAIYSVLQSLAANNTLRGQSQFMSNLSRMYVLARAAETAASYEDQQLCQSAITELEYISNNLNLFF